MSLKVLFVGTPAFAVPSLEALLRSSHKLAAVITQPDRPAGRGRIPKPSPVKQLALKAGLKLMEPPRVEHPGCLDEIRLLEPDVGVVVAYGRILPSSFLKIPRFGCLNLHASLLPRHRGAAPVAWAILMGDEFTGVSVMQMDEGLDTGPVMATVKTPIGPQEDAQELSQRLSRLGADLLLETLGKLEEGGLVPSPQKHEEATYAPRLRKQDGRIAWEETAERIARKVRALVPWPSAYTYWGGRRLKILKARALALESGQRPGRVIKAKGENLWIATGGGTLQVLELQPEAKTAMTAQAFLSGRGMQEGDLLSSG